jgi:hypothetical protein
MGTERTSQIIIYQTKDGQTKLDVHLEDETVWLTQEQMAGLYGKSKSTINEHIKNIYEEKELTEESTMRKFGISEYSTKPTNFYNLDVIISVGYRVKSVQGTQFRIWATQRIKEYIIKGFTLDDKRLKQGGQNEFLACPLLTLLANTKTYYNLHNKSFRKSRNCQGCNPLFSKRFLVAEGIIRPWI